MSAKGETRLLVLLVAFVAIWGVVVLRFGGDQAPVEAAVAQPPAEAEAAQGSGAGDEEIAAPSAPDVAEVEFDKPADGGAGVVPQATAKEAPSFDLVRVDATGGALVAGMARPRSEVAVEIDGAEVTRTTSDGQGSFAALFDIAQSNDAQVLALVSYEADGTVLRSVDSVILAPSQAARDSLSAEASGTVIAADGAEVSLGATTETSPPTAGIGRASSDTVAAASAADVATGARADPSQSIAAGIGAELSDAVTANGAEVAMGASTDAERPAAAGIGSDGANAVAARGADASLGASTDADRATAAGIGSDGAHALAANGPDGALSGQVSEGSEPTAGITSQSSDALSATSDAETALTARSDAGRLTNAGGVAAAQTEANADSVAASDVGPDGALRADGLARAEVPGAIGPSSTLSTEQGTTLTVPATDVPGTASVSALQDSLAAGTVQAGQTQAVSGGGATTVAALQTVQRQAPSAEAPGPTTSQTPQPSSAEDQNESPAAPETATAPEPVAPLAEEPTPGGAPAVLLADAQGVRVLQASGDRLGAAIATNIAIEAIGYTTAGDVRLSGSGPVKEGRALRVYLNNRRVADAQLGETGRYELVLSDVRPGVYTLRVDLLKPDGSVASRFETPFKREDPDVLRALSTELETVTGLTASVITVQPGFTLWGIASDRYGDGLEYVKVFDANRELIRDPDLIYPGQVFDLPQ